MSLVLKEVTTLIITSLIGFNGVLGCLNDDDFSYCFGYRLQYRTPQRIDQPG